MKPIETSRRRFLAGAAAATAIAGFPNLLLGQAAPAKLKIGLIGAGGRGSGAAHQALSADPDVILWAVGDAFPEKITSSLEGMKDFGARVDVPAARQFSGLDAYQKVIESDVDVVLLASPPGFRPLHLRAAIEAGKHVFAEKPMAIDVTGVKSVMESAKLAKQKGVSIQHGFCWRFAPGVRELYGKITSGELGRIYSVYGRYLSSAPKPLDAGMTKTAGMGDVEWQIRWWNNFEWTSGGPLLEQAIHTVDKVAWAMGDIAPIAAIASGGRSHRRDIGNVYDNYSIAYEYPGGVIAQVAERQYLADCFQDVSDFIYCEKGTAVAPSSPMVLGPDGKKRTWMYRAQPGAEQDMYQVCHNEFFAAIRKGEIINTGEYMANSTMLGLLGREAAHTGRRITWEEMWAANQDLAPDTLKMGDAFPIAPVPVPGVYQFA